MEIKSNVFGSKSERRNYQKLVGQWGDRFNIFQNLPFLMVLDVSNSEVSQNVYNFLLKTSIDFVICEEINGQDKPILAIEFDGLQQGINIGKEYLPKNNKDTSRKWRIETKLNIAYECKFPLFVVGDKEFDFISKTGLTIVDGIIGEIASNKYFTREFKERSFEKYLADRGITEEEFNSMNRSDQREVFESFGISVEVDADMENPIIKKRWEIYRTIQEKMGYRVGISTLLWSEGGTDVHDRERFTGGKFTWLHPDIEPIQTIIILPQFKLPERELYIGSLARNIAALIGIVEVAQRLGIEVE